MVSAVNRLLAGERRRSFDLVPEKGGPALHQHSDRSRQRRGIGPRDHLGNAPISDVRRLRLRANRHRKSRSGLANQTDGSRTAEAFRHSFRIFLI
jgi:hypothetical protein